MKSCRYVRIDISCVHAPFRKAISVAARRGEELPVQRIGGRCHELRILDEDKTWRIVYRIDLDAIVIVEVFAKKTSQTPKHIIDTCKKRLARYDQLAGE